MGLFSQLVRQVLDKPFIGKCPKCKSEGQIGTWGDSMRRSTANDKFLLTEKNRDGTAQLICVKCEANIIWDQYADTFTLDSSK